MELEYVRRNNGQLHHRTLHQRHQFNKHEEQKKKYRNQFRISHPRNDQTPLEDDLFNELKERYVNHDEIGEEAEVLVEDDQDR